jgi:hypothetical protein
MILLVKVAENVLLFTSLWHIISSPKKKAEPIAQEILQRYVIVATRLDTTKWTAGKRRYQMTRGGLRPGAGRPKNNTPRFGKWTRVEDALPEPYVDVLVGVPGKVYGVTDAISTAGTWLIHPNAKFTHWMPLPPPPES